jgi:hypothetical protein
VYRFAGDPPRASAGKAKRSARLRAVIGHGAGPWPFSSLLVAILSVVLCRVEIDLGNSETSEIVELDHVPGEGEAIETRLGPSSSGASIRFRRKIVRPPAMSSRLGLSRLTRKSRQASGATIRP